MSSPFTGIVQTSLDECVVYTSVSQPLRGTALGDFEPVLAGGSQNPLS